MTFICEACNFETNDKSKYKRHLKTLKHKNKQEIFDTNDNFEEIKKNKLKKSIEKKITICEFCNHNFGSYYNLKRHVNKCIKKEISRLQEENDKLKKCQCSFCGICFSTVFSLTRHKKQCNDFKLILKKKDDKINEIKLEKKILKTKYELTMENFRQKIKNYEENKIENKELIGYFKKTLSESISIANKITLHCPNNPPLVKIEPKKLPYFNENDNKLIVNDFISHYNNKVIYEKITNIILSVYKKEDKNEQSIYITDTSRLNYLIRQTVNKENKWVPDKKGVKTGILTIKPLLNHIRALMIDFIEKNYINDYQDRFIDYSDIVANKLSTAHQIIKDIDDGKFKSNIIKKLAPNFTFEINEKKLTC